MRVEKRRKIVYDKERIGNKSKKVYYEEILEEV